MFNWFIAIIIVILLVSSIVFVWFLVNTLVIFYNSEKERGRTYNPDVHEFRNIDKYE